MSEATITIKDCNDGIEIYCRIKRDRPSKASMAEKIASTFSKTTVAAFGTMKNCTTTIVEFESEKPI